MEIRKILESTLYDAMRNKDELTKNTIRMVMTSVKLTEVEKGNQLEDQDFFSILNKEIKMRRETFHEFESMKRTDLLEKAQSEIKILETFLPKQLTDEEIKHYAGIKIAELGATSTTDVGKVMKSLVPELLGKATADRISAAVRELLS